MRPDILDRAERAGHVVFENGDYNLNLIGQRTASREANAFDDWLHAAYKVDGEWVHKRWACTTDPGTYWLEHPLNVDGTAILVPGQYRGAYGLGLHRGKYLALTQRYGEVAVYRDSNMDGVLNPAPQEPQWGWFGINIHRATSSGTSTAVEKWSAGCQVVANSQDFAELLVLAEAAEKAWGARITYTLIGD